MGARGFFPTVWRKITFADARRAPVRQDLSFNASMIAVLDNNLYHQYALAGEIV